MGLFFALLVFAVSLLIYFTTAVWLLSGERWKSPCSIRAVGLLHLLAHLFFPRR
jgi:hypothetical protein